MMLPKHTACSRTESGQLPAFCLSREKKGRRRLNRDIPLVYYTT